MLTVDIDRQCDYSSAPDDETIKSWAQGAYEEKTPGEVAISIVDTSSMIELNSKYRGVNGATNVLSFPSLLSPVDNILHLGDIVLCAPVINKEAEKQEKIPEHHWAHMTIHGMLHLQKYDHVEPDQALAMEERETKILEQFGIKDPYSD